MTSQHLYIPKMKINKFREILDLPEIDRFKVDLINTRIDMSIHQGEDKKYFIFHSAFMVYGWTTSFQDAFTAKGNACIYDAGELYDLMRGKKLRINCLCCEEVILNRYNKDFCSTECSNKYS
jgi:hypothetical protein